MEKKKVPFDIYRSEIKLNVGERYYDGIMTDMDGFPHSIPFLVMRESTKEEYIEFVNSQDAPLIRVSDSDFYYEVSID